MDFSVNIKIIRKKVNLGHYFIFGPLYRNLPKPSRERKHQSYLKNPSEKKDSLAFISKVCQHVPSLLANSHLNFLM